MNGDTLTALRAADPVRRIDIGELIAHPVFSDLAEAIVTGEFEVKDELLESDDILPRTGTSRQRLDRTKRPRLTMLLTVAAALVLLAAGLTFGLDSGGRHPADSLLNGAQITPWRAARLLPVTLRPSASQGSNSWQLVSLVVDQGWQVNTSGPPPSQLACPTVTACYALAVRYASPNAGARPESVSLYVSSDLGTTWSVLPMPTGFLPTSQLSCPTAQACAVGGTQGGQPAFAMTTDAGHQWRVVSMSGADSLQKVACSSPDVCVGVMGHQGQPNSTSWIVRTDDGGTSWTPATLPISGTVLSLSCPTDQVCVAVGYPGAFRDTAAGFVLKSDDGGQSWTPGSLPQNFGFAPVLTAISCADASSCMAIGDTSVPNPRKCQGTPPYVSPPAGFNSCSTDLTALISTVVASSDGGITWHLRPLPADIPIPQLFSLSCASATVCWTAGQEAVPEVVGNAHNDGSPVMVGTTDSGLSWSKATFVIPPDAPNYLGQSFLGIGDISCPSTSACLALGGGAQSAPSTPIYRYENGAP
jgi:hypothetical protein